MTRVVTAREANQQFSKILAHAEKGEETVILKRGAPVAKLVPITDADRAAERASRRQAFQELTADLQRNSFRIDPDWTFDRNGIYDERLDRLDRR